MSNLSLVWSTQHGLVLQDPTAHEISSLAKRVLVAIQQTDPADTQADNSSDPLAHLITDIHNKAHSILHEMENEAPVGKQAVNVVSTSIYSFTRDPQRYK